MHFSPLSVPTLKLLPLALVVINDDITVTDLNTLSWFWPHSITFLHIWWHYVYLQSLKQRHWVKIFRTITILLFVAVPYANKTKKYSILLGELGTGIVCFLIIWETRFPEDDQRKPYYRKTILSTAHHNTPSMQTNTVYNFVWNIQPLYVSVPKHTCTQLFICESNCDDMDGGTSWDWVWQDCCPRFRLRPDFF